MNTHLNALGIFVVILVAVFAGVADVVAQTPQGLQSLPQSRPAQDRVIAHVNGEAVRQSDILRMLEQLPAEVRQLPQGQLFALLIDRAVDRSLVISSARENGFANDPAIQARLKAAEDDVLWEVFLERKIQEGMTAARVRKAYDRLAGDAAEEAVKARHILLAGEEDARAVIRELQGGADFQTLARAKSMGPSRETGGDLGYFTRDQMVDEFSTAAFAMETGAFSKVPVKTQFGWHVILVEYRRRAEAPTLEQALPQLRQEITREILTEVIGALRKDADIQIVGSQGELLRPGAPRRQ